MGAALEFLDDPDAFLEAAGDLLAAAPVESTVVATVAATLRAKVAAGAPAPRGFPTWWLVVRDDSGAVVGAGMRTASTPPHPPYLLAMPGEAARDLAALLGARGEHIRGVNGALPAVEVFATEAARLAGGAYRVAEHTRLFELHELREPSAVPPGRLRLAGEDDLDLAAEWFAAFGAEAAEQAGRSRPHPGEGGDRDEIRRVVSDRRIWLWEDQAGRVVHLTAANPTAFGVARIGPVYTPADHRGQGYAGATVAAVSRTLLDEGARVCLFTDQANPTSNALYERLGFRRVVDQANLGIDLPPSS